MHLIFSDLAHDSRITCWYCKRLFAECMALYRRALESSAICKVQRTEISPSNRCTHTIIEAGDASASFILAALASDQFVAARKCRPDLAKHKVLGWMRDSDGRPIGVPRPTPPHGAAIWSLYLHDECYPYFIEAEVIGERYVPRRNVLNHRALRAILDVTAWKLDRMIARGEIPGRRYQNKDRTVVRREVGYDMKVFINWYYTKWANK